MTKTRISRRDLLKALLPLTVVPRLKGMRLKITDVRLLRLRLVKELGSYIDFNGRPRSYRLGGNSYVEVHTDQGLIGIGPGLSESLIEGFKSQLVGKDPFDIEHHAARLNSGRQRGGASIEVALWDLIGKAADQPLYKLWGGVKDRIKPYASLMALSTPEDRAERAADFKARGWHAIKFRSRFPDMRDDIRMIELARKAVGDDWVLTADANMAGTSYLSDGVVWDFKRALDTARAYQEMRVFWLEEPLPRYDYDHIAELNRQCDMYIAGGEGNNGLHEFRALLEQGCYDIIQPEILWSGVLAARKSAVLAESMGKYCIPHNGGGNLGTVCCFHLVGSWPSAPYVELQNEEPVGDYRNGFFIMEDPPLVGDDGYIQLPDKPGLGVSIKRDLILKS
jgi:L-alanine-DL-glutamate epimerase-like enolase superfamily enzyme